MKGKFKKPPLNQGRRVTVSPQQAEQDSSIDYPIFCLKHLQSGYDLSICDKDEKAALIDQLSTLSKLTWNTIKLLPRHGMGSEKIARGSINPAIPSFVSDDVDFFLAFRFQGRKPFIGHRNGVILHILYIDRAFTAYSH